MQREWSGLLNTGITIPWRRVPFIVVGQGRAGKTALVRALRNLPFEHTDSTAGVASDTLETTDMHEWVEVGGSDCEQVTSCV